MDREAGAVRPVRIRPRVERVHPDVDPRGERKREGQTIGCGET